MRIVIDARIINTSTGRYVERLLTYLEKVGTKDEFIVLVPSSDKHYWKPSKPNFRIEIADFPNYSFAEQIGLAFLLYRLKPDLVHFCMPQQPLLYFGKRVTTIHDLTLVRFENIDMNPLVYKIRKLIFTLLLKNVTMRSKAILTPTEFVRKDVLDFTSQKYAPKVIKTLEAWDKLPDKVELIPELKDKEFIFFVGNAFPYKNLHTIVDAFVLQYKKRPELYLAFAGKKDIFYKQLAEYIKEKGVADRTFILGFISEGQKRWMFKNGQAYVVASLSEGFHIPGLEAMSENCPVISSNATCLPEVYDSAAYYFNPNSSSELSAAIDSIVGNEATRSEFVRKGKERLKAFSWKRMAEQTYQTYLFAVDPKNSSAQ
jgi:glycosyltransferase involved in cell wall biosynthesis